MEERKNDHIALAFTSRVEVAGADRRFDYEPALGVHPPPGYPATRFAGKELRLPLWVSSMTGGSAEARTINRNLATACGEFGMGMGLGSCRILLDDPGYFPDFDVRDFMGDDLPLFANIGIAQAEQMVAAKRTDELAELVHRLRADGLIVHINPVQEWLQQEGCRILVPPVETIQALLEISSLPLIVKEVGQGMGPASLEALLRLPLTAIEFAALGGTNFARVEMARSTGASANGFEPVSRVGHTAPEMLDRINEMVREGKNIRCRQLIISGGIENFLDGYYLISKSQLPALYGQASAFLRHARGDYDTLRGFVAQQAEGLRFARAFLKVRIDDQQ